MYQDGRLLQQFSLKDLGLVDAAPEVRFDNLTALAESLIGAQVSLVSIVEHENDRQFFKSHRGLPEPWASQQQTPLSHSFCQHVVASNQPLVVENAPEHALVCSNLAIRDLGVKAYLGVPIHAPDNRPIGALCVIEGTPRAWTEAELAKLQKLAACVSDTIRLRAALMAGEALRREQREFTYAISHDLKSPTNTLRLLLNELTEEATALSDDGREFLSLGLDTVERMARLVEDVLAYVRTEGEALKPQRIDLNQLVAELLASMKADIDASGARIDCAAFPDISGNRMQIEMLFRNLISNAVKYHRPGVPPVVTITCCEDPSGRSLKFRFTDNGIGIAPEHHAAIFRMFNRLHVREHYPGTGLGLTMCDRVAKNHGGKISLTSEPDQGSTFTAQISKDFQ